MQAGREAMKQAGKRQFATKISAPKHTNTNTHAKNKVVLLLELQMLRERVCIAPAHSLPGH
jgi:hypothetical protein